MKTTSKTTNSKPSTVSSSTQEFVSEGGFLKAIMEFTAYERGWGPVPSAASIAILAEQRGGRYRSSRSDEVTSAYTLTSYYDLARHAPLTERVPYLPQFCPHSIQPFVPPRSSGCKLCARQLLACDIWFSWSSTSTGAFRAPPVFPATSTFTAVERRSIYYALGIPLSEFDLLCINRDIAKSIMIPRRTPLIFPSNSNQKPTVHGLSRIRTLFRRARHVFSVQSRVPVMATPRLVHNQVAA